MTLFSTYTELLVCATLSYHAVCRTLVCSLSLKLLWPSACSTADPIPGHSLIRLLLAKGQSFTQSLSTLNLAPSAESALGGVPLNGGALWWK